MLYIQGLKELGIANKISVVNQTEILAVQSDVMYLRGAGARLPRNLSAKERSGRSNLTVELLGD